MCHFVFQVLVFLVIYLQEVNLHAQSQQNIIVNVEDSKNSISTDFSSDLTYSCEGTIQFKDLSTNSPISWLWQFGDGGLSTDQDPIYTYANSGIYTVSLQVTNNLGVDTIIKTAYITIEKPEITSVNDTETCIYTSTQLSATYGSGTLQWYDGANTLIHTGPTFTTPSLIATTTYFVEEALTTSSINYAPPVDPAAIGSGGYHGSNFTGGVNFTAYKAFEIVSVWVDADESGNRTIYLYDGFVPDGNATITNTILDQVTVNVPDGQSRIQLNLQVPGAGDYCLGGNEMDMYRNNTATAYPYSVSGILDKVSSTYFPDYYYYFYDWELAMNTECISTREPIVAKVINANFSSVINGGTVIFTDNSTGATNWNWDFGDGNTSTVQNPIHTYTNSNGPHIVSLSINNGTCTVYDSISLSVGIEEIADDLQLVIAPNPATNTTRISFNQALPEDLNIELINTEGKLMIKTIITAGNSSISLDINSLPPNMYFIRLTTNKIVDVRKLIVQQR
ncbi:MAG: PKD domain-containing protein [Saprospiraceae bacterium]|nr:PKD domain-containing protein [Saprospiraceae bacterium]